MEPAYRTIGATAVILAVGLVNAAAGKEYAVSVFFLFPIAAIAWYDGMRTGIILSGFSAAIWLAADLMHIERFSDAHIPFFNETFRLIVFIFAAVIVARLKKALEVQRDIARTDPLTGMRNRLAFFESAGRELQRARRFRKPLSFIYLDIDKFKAINDTHGHKTGDRLLQQVANTIRENIRAVDMAVRFGGDEMGILLVETDADGARFLAEKLQDKLMAEMNRHAWPVTFSMGLGTFRQTAVSVEDMIQLVDKIMYLAKKSGKNRIVQRIFAAGSIPCARKTSAG